jgi:hypothetical protein
MLQRLYSRLIPICLLLTTISWKRKLTTVNTRAFQTCHWQHIQTDQHWQLNYCHTSASSEFRGKCCVLSAFHLCFPIAVSLPVAVHHLRYTPNLPHSSTIIPGKTPRLFSNSQVIPGCLTVVLYMPIILHCTTQSYSSPALPVQNMHLKAEEAL